MSSIKFISLLILVFLISCKGDSTKKPLQETEESTVDKPIEIKLPDGGVELKATNLEYDMKAPTNQSVAGPNTIKSMRQQANSILKKRIKDSNTVPAIVERGTFFYEFIVKGSNVSEVGTLDNKWIDFKDDWTYTYGFNRDEHGGGRFHYNSDNAVLLQIDNDESIKPQEFNAKHAGNALVLVGTPVYKDNNMQMKLGKVVIDKK